MKKSMFFAFALAGGLLSSCSSDDAIESSNVAANETAGLQEIKLGIAGNSIVGTRGTGTVGGVKDPSSGEIIEGGTHSWNGQLFNVFMLNHGTIDIATFSSKTSDSPLNENGGVIFDNAQFRAPVSGEDGYAYMENVKYYPQTGRYDFFGYYLDDAAVNNPAKGYAPNEENTELYVNFKINGSQDIMFAKAEPYATKSEVNAEDYTDEVYSAKTARNGIIPNLRFSHHLTRLRFNVLPEGVGIAEQIQVVGIRVKSKTTGKAIVVSVDGASLEGNNQGIVWDETAEKEFCNLGKRDADNNIVPLVEGLDYDNIEQLTYSEIEALKASFTSLNAEGDNIIGEALLVSPEDSYDIELILAQTVAIKQNDSFDGTEFATEVYSIPFDGVKTPSKTPFKAGHSYNVSFKVYGLQKIEIFTTLEAWEKGEDVPLDPDTYENN